MTYEAVGRIFILDHLSYLLQATLDALLVFYIPEINYNKVAFELFTLLNVLKLILGCLKLLFSLGRTDAHPDLQRIQK